MLTLRFVLSYFSVVYRYPRVSSLPTLLAYSWQGEAETRQGGRQMRQGRRKEAGIEIDFSLVRCTTLAISCLCQSCTFFCILPCKRIISLRSQDSVLYDTFGSFRYRHMLAFDGCPAALSFPGQALPHSLVLSRAIFPPFCGRRLVYRLRQLSIEKHSARPLLWTAVARAARISSVQ